MLINEMYGEGIPGYQDVEDDGSKVTKDDLRKTRLTLKQINKLRQMNDVRNFEFKEKLKKVQRQYAVPAEAPPQF
jgi:hypothetical protein